MATTPESPSATAIDDLTTALSSFSRPHTPDPQIVCCCGRDGCECTSTWMQFREKLESRLVLSAEVGQALLARHEAYVRRQDAALSREASSIFSEDDETSTLKQQVEYLTKKLDTVTEENTLMESRLNEVLIKHEMTDASSRTLMRELQESRAAIGRLSAQNARSAGWEIRLAQLTQERDDMRQERDSEAQRARQAESKAAAFVDKCSKLQSEVYTLREEVHNFRASREDFSKNVLQEARARLESYQHSLGRDRTPEDPETTRVLESLVADNETLKRDIAELQNLLLEARDELDEHRAATAPSLLDDITKVGTPPSSHTLYMPRSPVLGRVRGHGSAVSPSSMLYGLPHAPNTMFAPSPRSPPSLGMLHRRSPSGGARLLGDDAITEWRHDSSTLLSPLRPRSPADSLLPPEGKHTHLPQRYSPLHLHHGGEGELERAASPASFEKHKGSVRPLLLLNRSCGVQTDPQSVCGCPLGHPSMSTVDRDVERGRDSTPSTPAPEGRSDTSSLNQQDPRNVTTLIERATALLARMVQTDVKSLTNRLKRQHLSSGDVGHVSRATIGGILAEASGLRIHGRDDATVVTNADLKALRKFVRDVFAELGALRGQLNEVVLDPGVAHRLRKEALEPDQAKGEGRPTSAMGGWIAPIQKLFAHPIVSVSATPESPPAANTHASELGRGRAPVSARVVPKLAPAIAATSTTVNVEFANTGVRKTDTSDGSLRVMSSPAVIRAPVAVPHTSSRQLMGIFAGAPQSSAHSPPTGRESWVVLPKPTKDRLRALKGAASSAALGNAVRHGRTATATIGRASPRNANRLSRNVDAVIDQNDGDVTDFRETLLARTLRPRGYSDSSIHTSFLNDEPASESHAQKPEESSEESSSQDTDVVVSFAQSQTRAVGVTTPPPSAAAGFILNSPSSRSKSRPAPHEETRARSPVARLGRNLASWATAAAGGLHDLDTSEIFIGSPREDSILHHGPWTRRGLEGREA